ncbi:MAG: hypothetical protein ACRD5Z_05145, partial [Bryobacteraceae bacterium]
MQKPFEVETIDDFVPLVLGAWRKNRNGKARRPPPPVGDGGRRDPLLVLHEDKINLPRAAGGNAYP